MAFTVVLMPMETFLAGKSSNIATQGFPEYRWSYTGKDLDAFFGSLGFDHLRIYLVYQFSDLLKTFVLTLFWIDLLTYSLRYIKSLSSLDTLPFVYGVVGVLENFLLFFLTVRWPVKYPQVVMAASICTSFKRIISYLVFALIVVGFLPIFSKSVPKVDTEKKEK
eukprot:TRINITY_DN10386_c0_g1_i1.p1 TRINITY_DN10386_c0_g1~~TRINITY_DN10386_c0_g1_i1.p1  ORF type:complete len:185 (-),score=21.12 TRINITY_DN10386_c0_g1_i1:73-567(-)